MLAPDGHYNWTEIYDSIDRLGEALFLARFEHLRGRDPVSCFLLASPFTTYSRIAEVAGTSTPAQAEFFKGLLKCWLLAQFFVTYEPFLCSREGRPIRADLQVCLHADRLDRCDWKWQWGESRELRKYFLYHDINGFCANDVYVRFCAVDHTRGIVTLKNNTAALLNAATQHCPVPLTDWTALVTRFAGLSICWRHSDVPDLLSDILTDFGMPEAEWALLAEQAPSRRSIQKNDLLRRVLDAYPDGKGSESWSEIEQSLGLSRRMIARTLRDQGRYSGWVGSEPTHG